MRHIARPGIDLLTRNGIPRSTFPITEINFRQTDIKPGRRMQGLGQMPATLQGTAPHRQAGRQAGTQGVSGRLDIFGHQIELTVANAGLDPWPRMTNEVKNHPGNANFTVQA